MYDWIKCDVDLPGKPDPEVKVLAQSGKAKTRSFNCRRTTYTITSDGFLLRMGYTLEILPKEQRTYYGKPEWEINASYRWAGIVRRKLFAETRLSDYQGNILFYIMTDDWKFYDYIAHFIQGRLEVILQVGDNYSRIPKYSGQLEPL